MRSGRSISPRELEVVAAWWHEGTVVGAADLLGISEQTAITDPNPIHNRYRPVPPTAEEWLARQARIIATVQNRGRAA